MIGNDCKLLEDNCKKLIEHFFKVIYVQYIRVGKLSINLSKT